MTTQSITLPKLLEEDQIKIFDSDHDKDLLGEFIFSNSDLKQLLVIGDEFENTYIIIKVYKRKIQVILPNPSYTVKTNMVAQIIVNIIVKEIKDGTKLEHFYVPASSGIHDTLLDEIEKRLNKVFTYLSDAINQLILSIKTNN